MSERELAPSPPEAGTRRINGFVRNGWFVLGALWAALCLVVFVGGIVTSALAPDSYVDGGAIASAAAMLGLFVGGAVWLLGYLLIDVFSHDR
jgi:hypothetical protein